MITTSAQWKSLVQLAGGEMTVLARLYYGLQGATDYISLADRDGVSIGAERFLGVLEKVPDVASLLNMDTHEYGITNFNLLINNLEYEPGGRFSDILEDTAYGTGTSTGFENRRIDIRVHLPGITSFANCFKLMEHGKILDIDHSREVTTISVEDQTEIIKGAVGTLLTGSDAASLQAGVLPEDSADKIRPEIYGDRSYWRGETTDLSLTTGKQEHSMAPIAYRGVGISAVTGNVAHFWFVAGHLLGPDFKLFGWFPSFGRYLELIGFDIEEHTSDGCTISHSLNAAWRDCVYGDGTASTEVNVGSGDWTDEGRGNNSDVDDYAYSSIEAAWPAVDSADIYLDFSGWKLPSGSTVSTNVAYAIAWYSRGSGISDNQVTFIIGDSGNLPPGLASGSLEIVSCGIGGASSEAGANEGI
ncbi:MAG: hypothetical protein KAU50_06540, partial [Candidatus Marinimicrobia bacterium]|nr:hypothetical protein [Candidatus Neomarinimicrobiota bacterium]